ncbi:MAG: succinylglutamate desuccinylase/aspartoacylase family protein [Halioglobus sp.]
MRQTLFWISGAGLLSLFLSLWLLVPHARAQMDAAATTEQGLIPDLATGTVEAYPEQSPTGDVAPAASDASPPADPSLIVDTGTPANPTAQPEEAAAAAMPATDVPQVDAREQDFLIQSIGAAELQDDGTQTGRPEPAPVERPRDAGRTGDAPILRILGTDIGPGESHRLHWVAGETSYGSKLETPVYVIRGKYPGPTLCLTAAIHGDELNGVEIVRQLVSDLSPKKLHGAVIGVPIVNLLGFTRGTRYLPDRRDLNRYFPGNPEGSSASRIAYSLFENIVRQCDLLIDSAYRFAQPNQYAAGQGQPAAP